MSGIGKIAAILIVIFLILAGIYFLMGDETALPSNGLVREDFDAGGFGENQEFLSVLKNLENVSLDGSILSTESFASLVDFSLELAPQPTGRINPFRPINPFEL